ncbi:hypothetical protein SEA_BARB_71 [Gordonia phage Barb]|uniref:Uncharacterized protein n=1 Tax=Gordonia phage Barb TaxID=2588128 RepID=A0A4Y5TZ75_9CAUD|nr:hypothetical protein KNU55_gp71 [Gordonia phage Barb]QDB74747.1 hypothetical protein SEA_BARB_71 [Gordonia phage Barb]QXO14450.1 hypothetical protein SEA_FUGAX_72 [Gordonia phage Fugax]WNM73185.1 hypothetical protein SEA_CLAMCHOWDER_71 [Gordonia phage ClamChowder]
MPDPQPELADEVDAIIETGKRDPEDAHGREDSLLRRMVRAYAPAWVNAELDRLAAADFDRWCA